MVEVHVVLTLASQVFKVSLNIHSFLQKLDASYLQPGELVLALHALESVALVLVEVCVRVDARDVRILLHDALPEVAAGGRVVLECRRFRGFLLGARAESERHHLAVNHGEAASLADLAQLVGSPRAVVVLEDLCQGEVPDHCASGSDGRSKCLVLLVVLFELALGDSEHTGDLHIPRERDVETVGPRDVVVVSVFHIEVLLLLFCF